MEAPPIRPGTVPLTLPETGLAALFGIHDENLRLLEEAFGVEITARGREVSLSGEPESTDLVARLLSQLTTLMERGWLPKRGDVASSIRIIKEDPESSLVDFFENRSVGAVLRQVVTPRNVKQQEYLQAISEHDIVFAIGPAGTGKTYLAVAMAAAALLEKTVKRIVLCRPAVEAGEKLGFLPGDLAEKVNPYLRPLHDALYDILGYEKVGRMMERTIIEVAPLAFMRGRTLNDAFIILDEAQNTTSEQMKMFLTRLGFGSKAVVTGDVTQIDLPPGKISGLKEAERVLADVAPIRFVRFDHRDVVRHRIVQAIVNAYDLFEQARRDEAAPPPPAPRPSAG
ncbi:MAG TPA: PhoH family protein [Thermoanaerobaculia bacterium]|nr:PhoH family protein [Thermoanaerobaculia bacterium]